MDKLAKSSGDEKSIVTLALEAYYQPKIRDIEASMMDAPIVGAITKAIQTIGGNGTADDIDFMATEFIVELRRSFIKLSIQEVCLAIDLGSKGLLKAREIVHVTLKTLLMWVAAFEESIRMEAMQQKKLQEQELERAWERKKEERDILYFEECIIEEYENFCTGIDAEIDIIAAAMYRHVSKKIEVPLSTAEKWAIYQQCEQEYIRMIRESKQDTAESTFQKKSREKAERLNEFTIQQNKISSVKIMAEAKALKEIFKRWEHEGYDLRSALKATHT